MKTVTHRPHSLGFKKPTLRREFAAPVAAVLIAGLLLLTGCAGQMARLDEEDKKALSSEPEVHAVHHKLNFGFAVDSSGHRAAGILVSPLLVIVGASQGMTLRNEFGLEDPAPQVKARLVTALQSDLGVARVRFVDEPPVNDAITTLDREFRNGIVLDVLTLKWGLYNARAQYSARARLIRLSDARILWEATCKSVAGEKEPSPELETLKANGGALLKARISEAASICADQLSAWMVGSTQ